jgi:hypothetical protein
MRPRCVLVAMLAGCGAIHAAAVTFDTRTVALEHPPNGDLLPLSGSSYLAVTGHSAVERWLSLVNIETLRAERIDVPADAQFIGKGTLAKFPGERLLFLGRHGVSAYLPESGELRRLIQTSSLYRNVDAKRLREIEFAVDLNDNGLTDVLIPDFDAFHLFLQQDDGRFLHHELPIGAEMRTQERVTSYVPRRPHLVDVSLNGRQDVVFVKDGSLIVFEQRDDGSFSDVPAAHALGAYLTPDLEADLRTGDGRDYQGLVVHRLQLFEDINGDGVADLVVRRQQYQDAIDQSDSYRIFYGRRSEQGLNFAAEPDALIHTEGMQLEPIFEDVNGNGRKDFGTITASIGIGTIIRALLTGGANMDILFYGMDDDGRFATEPDYRQRARVEISIRSGQAHMPLLRLADLRGEGSKYLVVGEGTDAMRLYAADADQLFVRRGERIAMQLPRDNSNVLVADLTGNGKDDLVLPFGPRDGDAQLNQLQLLLTR